MTEKLNQRVRILDILRGTAIIGMVFHHALVSYEILFEKDIDILYSEAFTIVQLIFVAVFLLVSGICTNYSRNVFKRGLIVFGAALLVSFATCVILPAVGFTGLNIYFGILHMFGLSMILYALLRKLLDKIPPIVGIIAFTLLFIGYYMFYRTGPTSSSNLLIIFGVLPESLDSYGDYYPLLPFFFLFVAGAYIGKYVKANRFPQWFYKAKCYPLELCGKYSLWVYVLHQPVIFSVMFVISRFVIK